MQKWVKWFCFPTTLNQTLSIFFLICIHKHAWMTKNIWNIEQVVAHDRAILCTMIHAWLWSNSLHHNRSLGCRKMMSKKMAIWFWCSACREQLITSPSKPVLGWLLLHSTTEHEKTNCRVPLTLIILSVNLLNEFASLNSFLQIVHWAHT